MSITLRERRKGDKISLYLDCYNQGKREYEYLNLYLEPEPEKGKLTKEQKEENRKILALAESIRSKRHLEIQNGIYGFYDKDKLKASFIEYFEDQADKRKNGTKTNSTWVTCIAHFRKFAKGDIAFSQVNSKLVEDFKEYLLKEVITIDKRHLSQNTADTYFCKFKATLREAYREGILPRNPADVVRSIKHLETERQYLTYEELQTAAKAECDIPVLKRAFLFSALAGLRWSDINKMTWSEVQHSAENGYYIRFIQQKTKGAETQPISEQAYGLLGKRSDNPSELVFKGLTTCCYSNFKIKEWMGKAGISKSITFHCARHTYATLQLSLGTDIYTVSKLLGHKNLVTTQIYAKVIDDRKKNAASLIKLDL